MRKTCPSLRPFKRYEEKPKSNPDLLRETIRAAQLQGLETIYQERHLVTADIGLQIRPRLAWYNNDEKKHEMFSYVAESCRRGRRELEDTIQGIGRLPEADDTQVSEPLIRPLPRLKGRPINGSYFMDDHNEPMMIVSLHSPSQMLQRFFATPFPAHRKLYASAEDRGGRSTTRPFMRRSRSGPTRTAWDGTAGAVT